VRPAIAPVFEPPDHRDHEIEREDYEKRKL